MLFYSEQLLLLTVDPVSGRLFPVPEQILHLTLAGALLFDASFSSLINDDWKQVEVLETMESGNAALDEALRCLLIVERSMPLDRAISIVAAHGSTLSKMVWDSLQKKGVIISRKSPIFNSYRKQEHHLPNLSAVIAIHKKIKDIILSEEIPDFKLPPLISLIEAGGLTKYILKSEERNRFSERISWLSNMESLGREIISSIRSLEKTNLETDVAHFIGLRHDQPKTFAGGMDAVLTSLAFLYKEAGINRSRKLIGKFNQVGGFECTSCAWPNPDKNRSHFEFCENGAKNISSLATTRLVTSEFFDKWSVQELQLTSDYWLEQQGRLGEPMFLDEYSTHYKTISWEESFRLIGDELNSLHHPDEAIFYASGRTSNEAAFLYQLFARTLGTNNLPNSANLCHEPSGKALTMSLGFGKSSVTLDDFPKADAIFVFGHNPGSNHPRMLSSLQSAVRNGCKIVAVNPMPEASLMGFADPQEASSYFGKQTALSHLYIQPMINGDMAFVRGMVKAIFEIEEREGGVLDLGFIDQTYKQLVLNSTWDELILASGVNKNQIEEAAGIYINAKNTISTWCLGITHHRNSVETIREIINLMLLKGNIGRPGAGVCPVRGHSNIQGIRTMGVGENMPVAFLENLEKIFQVDVPRTPGMSVIPAIKSMDEGRAKVLISLGGNLASAVPDSAFVEKALRNSRMTVMISTKLNRSHLITGKKALILPALSRLDEDIRDGIKQSVTIEDAMGKIGFSRGCLAPASSNMKSEVAIIAGMALATLGEDSGIEWQRFSNDNQLIRSTIAKTIPALRDIDKANSVNGFYLENPLRNRVFTTDTAKAKFSNYPLAFDVPKEGELFLMTIRSHDQFNTSIFGLNDRYRGISNERRVLFMNSKDMEQREIEPEQMVEISSRYDDKLRKIEGYYAIQYPIRQGCVAAYFPETNELTSINNISNLSQTPAYKSISVQVKALATYKRS